MFFALRKQFRRLSIRLTLWHALLFLVAALTALGVTYFVLQRQLLSEQRKFTQLLLDQYAGEYDRGGVPAVQTRAAFRKGRDQRANFIRIADAQNRTVFLRDAADWTEFKPDRLEKQTGGNAAASGWLTLDSTLGLDLLLGYKRLSDGSLIQLGETTVAAQKLLAGFRTVTIVVLLIFLPSSIVGGAFLASRALRPIQHLTEAVEQIVATARFDARVASSGTHDELDSLIHLFNAMLQSIDRLIHGMRDSLDNVAHDLRTPMTRLRQKAQAAIEGAEDVDAARDALADCVEEAERVTTLLKILMDIAEAESGLLESQHAPVSVVELVNSAVDSYAEVAEEKGVAVATEVSSDLRVSGDANALRRVFVNLLDNAIKFTPAGGIVRISASRTDGSVFVHFSDTGCGISADDLPRIWDRLFRGDRSRSERGLGLGLSFVRAIVSAHGGTATVKSEPGSGTQATINLPEEGREMVGQAS